MTRLAAFVVSACAGAALAQPCVSEWDGSPGTVGATGGYVGAFASWDSGAGPRLYAGGSFSKIGSTTGTKYIGSWNPTTGIWSKLGGGINQGNTNAFVASMHVFKSGATPGLIVGGFFANTSNLANTRSLSFWNGAAWEALPGNPVNVAPSSIWTMSRWTQDPTGADRLYLGGAYYADASSPPFSGIHAWDGTSFTNVATIEGDFSPTVFSSIVHDDGTGAQLYAGGRFQKLGGTTVSLIARWNGTTWSKVGAGLVALQSIAQVSAMAIHDDGAGPALYVAGGYFRVSGSNQTQTSVAKWNGAAWTRVGQNVGGYIYGLRSFDDGTGAKLYLTGTAIPDVNYVARFESGSWVALDGGLSGSVSGNFPSGFAMSEFEGNLVVGGDFTNAGTEPARGVVFRTSCVDACPPDFNNDGFLTGDDFDLFVAAFELGDIAADYNGDGFVTGDDFDAYSADFEAGC